MTMPARPESCSEAYAARIERPSRELSAPAKPCSHIQVHAGAQCFSHAVVRAENFVVLFFAESDEVSQLKMGTHTVR